MTDTLAIAAHGSVIAPAAGAPLASLAGLAVGEYEVFTSVYLSGAAAAAADADNVVLQVDGATIETLPVQPLDNVPSPWGRFVVYTRTGSIQLASVGAGTALVVYHVFLTAAPIPLAEYR